MSSEPISIAMVFRNMASPIISPVDIGLPPDVHGRVGVRPPPRDRRRGRAARLLPRPERGGFGGARGWTVGLTRDDAEADREGLAEVGGVPVTSPRTPRQLLGWTVPDHVEAVELRGGGISVTCLHSEHAQVPASVVLAGNSLTEEFVREELAAHSHGVAVWYRPEITGYPSSAIGSEPDLPLMSERRVPVNRAVVKPFRQQSEVLPETPEPPQVIKASYTLHEETVDVTQLRGRIAELEELCEIGSVNQDVAALRREVEQAREDLEEARGWAKHGYEIGQRSCTWSDQGVAPRWLIESYRPVPASQSVPAVPVSSTGGAGTREGEEAAQATSEAWTLHTAIAAGIKRGLADFGAELTGCTASALTGHVISQLREAGLHPLPDSETGPDNDNWESGAYIEPGIGGVANVSTSGWPGGVNRVWLSVTSYSDKNRVADIVIEPDEADEIAAVLRGASQSVRRDPGVTS